MIEAMIVGVLITVFVAGLLHVWDHRPRDNSYRPRWWENHNHKWW